MTERSRARRRTLVTGVALLVVLAATACGSAEDAVRAAGSGVETPPSASGSVPSSGEPSDGPTAEPSEDPTPTVTPPTSAPTSPAEVELPGIVGGITSFTAPSGNIGCYVDDRGARCDIRERDYTPPAEPESCALSWGSSLEVGPDGAGFACVGDTVMGSDTVLKYGNSTVVGEYGCVSQESGVTCIDRTSGHGFTLSRAAARTF